MECATSRQGYGIGCALSLSLKEAAITCPIQRVQEAYSGRSLALNLGGDLLEGEPRLGGVRLRGLRLGDLDLDLRAANLRGRGEIDLLLGETPSASFEPLRTLIACSAASPELYCNMTPAE